MATASSDESDDATDDNTAPLPQNPAMTLAKTGAWVDVMRTVTLILVS